MLAKLVKTTPPGSPVFSGRTIMRKAAARSVIILELGGGNQTRQQLGDHHSTLWI